MAGSAGSLAKLALLLGLLLVGAFDGGRRPLPAPGELLTEAFAFMESDDPLYSFACPKLDYEEQTNQRFAALEPEAPEPLGSSPQNDWLGNECQIIKVYNETHLESMDELALVKTAKNCACRLAYAYVLWERAFDDTDATRQLFAMVVNTLEAYRNGSRPSVNRHPDYLWSDIDVTIYKISIYTSTKDYFEKTSKNSSLLPSSGLRQELARNQVWQNIKLVCWRIAIDKFKLYRYLENLSRASPTIFSRLVEYSEQIEQIYQASKACKMLLGSKLSAFKLWPDNSQYVAVDQRLSLDSELPDSSASNNLISNDLDLKLREASTLLLRCGTWQRRRSSYEELSRSCPMMVGAKVPSEWILRHPSHLDRTEAAVKCACQLLLHNNTWALMMLDKNVQTMSLALTNFMNQRGVPDLENTSIRSIHGWFEDLMSFFADNRRRAIHEVVKTMNGKEDPLKVINRKTNDEAQALELIRRGCNLIMFNYIKDSRQVFELKLIKYLDNLQLISQDPLFVFHLTLQDTNLFKLHALSKMCLPFVK